MTTRFTLRFMLCCFSEKLSDQISQQSISKINETENKLKTGGHEDKQEYCACIVRIK